MDDLLERLRDIGCDREPFTPSHKDCVCRLANAAADEIERLRLFERYANSVIEGQVADAIKIKAETGKYPFED